MMTSQQSSERPPGNLAPNAMEMVRILAARNGNHSIGATLHHATGHELFRWWHEATAHSMTAPADAPWQKSMGEALASEIAKECVRRMAPGLL